MEVTPKGNCGGGERNEQLNPGNFDDGADTLLLCTFVCLLCVKYVCLCTYTSTCVCVCVCVCVCLLKSVHLTCVVHEGVGTAL